MRSPGPLAQLPESQIQRTWPVRRAHNLPAHKADGVRLAIEAAGGKLHYLLPYSPDFNPIDIAYSGNL
jgi:transposase